MPRAYLISGFLGSGKTTFILEGLLPLLKGEQITILVNDYGEVSFDKIKYYQERLDVLGIEGSCICCSAGETFLRTLELIKDRTSTLIVETSGVSGLYPIWEALEASGYVVEMVFTCLSLDLPERLYQSPFVRDQLEMAQCIILTKADLVNEAILKKRLKDIQGFKKPFFLSYEGRVDYSLKELLEVKGPAVNSSLKRGLKSVSKPRFLSSTFKPKGYYMREEVENFLKNLPPEVYRAKGILYIAQSPLPLALNYTCGYTSWERMEYQGEPFLTFIGEIPCDPYLQFFPSPLNGSSDLGEFMLPLGAYDKRAGLAYFKKKPVSEKRALKEILKIILKKDNFTILSGNRFLLKGKKNVKITDYRYQALLEVREALQRDTDRVLLIMPDLPEAIASFFIQALPKDFVIIHLGKRYLLPESYISLKLENLEKEKAIETLFQSLFS